MTSLRHSRFKQALSSDNYDLGMFTICVLYCMTALPGLDISDVFRTLILLGSAPVLYFCCKEKDYDKRIVYLFAASFVIQVVSWGNSLFVIPDAAKNYPDIKLLSNLFLFVFIAFWVGGNAKRRAILYGSLLLSLAITVFVDNYLFDSFSRALAGLRVDFDLHNAQFTTMIAAVAVMVAILLLTTLENVKKRPLVLLLLVSSIALSVFVFMVSQSRQVWLASAVILLLLPLMLAKKFGKPVTFGFYVLLAVAFVSVINSSVFQKRLADSNKSGDLLVVEQVLSGEWDNIPMNSFGIRFNSWLEASDWIAANPIVGASKEGVRQVLKTSERFQSNPRTKGFGHLHNYYLETLVAFGMVGLGFLIGFYYLVSQNILTRADYPTTIFFILFIVFWLLINNFESYNSKYYGLYIQNIILGGLFFMPKPSVLTVKGN